MMDTFAKTRAPRNRTLTVSEAEKARYRERSITLDRITSLDHIYDCIIRQDALKALHHLPGECADLIIVDPPYNRTKKFNNDRFSEKTTLEYIEWADEWIKLLSKKLKRHGSIYVCSDWQSSAAIQTVMSRYFIVRNRITWEREKGRGAKKNWKNCAEDIWFATKTDDFVFNLDAVKLSRKVIAPYRKDNGEPKDWNETESGNFRQTHPSNLWTDITVPFWSMPENTDHPTQKPEKLVAKLVLASSNTGDVVLDPFAGSGTTGVVAKKTDRHFIMIEVDEFYCCLAQKRLDAAATDRSIQGYADGVFWERNTLSVQRQASQRKAHHHDTIQPRLALMNSSGDL